MLHLAVFGEAPNSSQKLSLMFSDFKNMPICIMYKLIEDLKRIFFTILMVMMIHSIIRSRDYRGFKQMILLFISAI